LQTQPNYNFRGIELIDGIYQSKSSLCDRCFHPVCSGYTATSCKDYTLALKFKSPKGFDLENVNTFRLGKAWFKRLGKGSLVAVINSKTNTVFKYAYVTEVYFGNKQEMAELYGKDNHTMRYRNVTDNIATEMLKRLKSSSGSMIYNNTDTASVIYLEVLNDTTHS